MIPLVPIKRNCRQLKNHTKQVTIILNKLNTFTNKYRNLQLSTSRQKHRLFKKDIFKIIIFNKVVISEEVLNHIKFFNSFFRDEIKDLYTDKTYKKSQLVLQANNNKDGINI